MHNIFIDIFKKLYNFGKYSNIKFKYKALVYYTIKI